MSGEALLDAWDTEKDFSKRDDIYVRLKEAGISPDFDKEEHDGALYPDTTDKKFLQKLLKKREFAESKAAPFELLKEGEEDPCAETNSFEITPVQKFVSNFMSPETPYNSALLYHGTGVGKTQAAVQIAEGFLAEYPRKKIIVIAPGTIQSGWFRNIFDISKVVIGSGDKENTVNQGTGDLYMRLTGTLYEREVKVIERKINETIRRRYSFFGYLAFRNYIRKLIERKVGKKRMSESQITNRILREEFSGRVLIIDEAHHLRESETTMEEGEEADTVGAGGKADVDDTSAGSKLLPFLKQLLYSSEGTKLVLMTATPMYNTAKEILTLLNLLILNDKKIKDALLEKEFFDAAGNLKENSPKIGLLYNAASSYISFMRGENPRTFPVRLYPDPNIVSMMTDYPNFDPGGKVPISEEDKRNMIHLPLVQSYLGEDATSYMLGLLDEEIEDITRTTGRYGIGIRDRLIQAGNVLFPIDGDRYGEGAFTETFRKEGSGINMKYKCRDGIDPSWLSEERLDEYSAKAHTILRLIRSSRNVQFIYSRFVPTGALFLALMLEANGYTMASASRQQNLFGDGIQSPGGRQCALCSSKEKGHVATDHAFVPAKYVLLTGNPDVSPRNGDSIALSRSAENVDGRNVKVVIGSQVASEGVDLRFIREIHVFDSWYHLNKTDQVIGRGIRYCSHSLLSLRERNCTIYLHVVNISGEDIESIDMYSYRLALKKARQVGVVARIIKQHSLDCNLNKSAIQIIGQDRITMVDSQGRERKDININDMPFSPICDWLEKCEYSCVPEVQINMKELDESTYDEFNARHIEVDLKNRIRNSFVDTVFWYGEDFLRRFPDVSPQALGYVLDSVLDNKNFHITHKNIDGYLIYKNGFFLFQPSLIKDETIPLVMRTTFFPVRRDEYIPTAVKQVAIEDITRENAEEEVAIENKWGLLTAWVENILNGTYDTVSEDVKRLIKNMTGFDDSNYAYFTQLLHALTFVPRLFNKKEHLDEACLEYFFDEWLTQAERDIVITENNDKGAASESRVSVGSLKLIRYVDVKTGVIQYKKEEDGSSVPKSILDVISGSKARDPILSRQAIIQLTGPMYGFITTKKGKSFVFKQGIPVNEREKPGRGAECSITSETSNKKKNLDAIAALYGTQNIDRITLEEIKRTMNAFQLCAITNILFRVMDKQGVRRLRWFFRPIAAAAAGHKGKA